MDAEQIIIRWRAATLDAEEDNNTNKCVILLSRPYSMHPDDYYLGVVMAQLPNNNVTPYVTWNYNTSFGEVSYFDGHYFKDAREAFEDWKKR